MRKLEQEPDTYDSKFTALTKGINLEIQEWILKNIAPTSSVMEIGYGTGILSKKLALKGCDVVAIDKDFQMFNYAMKNYPTENNIKLLYQMGSFMEYPVDPNSKDVIISKFMVSELGPLEQQLFLRYAWKALKSNGRLIIAGEFLPSGIWKLIFNLKRWWYKKKLRKLKLKETHVVKWFFNYLEPIGFKIVSNRKWKHGTIQLLELIKNNDNVRNKPGYYKPKLRGYKGIRSQLRIYRCLFTGQIDYVAIEPGLYKSGNPNENSPIIVTSNYDYTYIKLMRDLNGIDAWVICIDSRGINVWCAARGNDFGNKQLIEAVLASGIGALTINHTLILPQLSAGGIAIPELPKNSEEFPFKIKFGPVWSKHIPKYLEEHPAQKPNSMKIAKFSLSHRLRAGITHTTFLFRKIFFIPIFFLLSLFLIFYFIFNWELKIWFIGELVLSIIFINMLISLCFPLSNFTRKFIVKGIFFGILSVTVLSIFNWILHNSIIFLLLNVFSYFWIAFFSTMSFSGYTMETNPREIQKEYPIFKRINLLLLLLSVFFSTISIILY